MAPQRTKPRVLVVDDRITNLRAFEAVLESEFDVTLADSGLKALELCKTEEFAVIVLDVRMPGMDGFETAEALRKCEMTRSTPIIIFTSAYEQTMAQLSRGFIAGATDFLFSPVEPELLKIKVKTYAQIFLSHEELRLKVHRLTESLSKLHAELDRRGLSVTELAEVEQAAVDINQKLR